MSDLFGGASEPDAHARPLPPHDMNPSAAPDNVNAPSPPVPAIAAPTSSATVRDPATAGAWLRAARQQRGIELSSLAVQLKVSLSKLEALEANRWQDLPDATYVRVLAKAVCGALKVDAAAVLALLPPSEDRLLQVSRGLNQPYRDRSGATGGQLAALLPRPVTWGAALLLLGAAGIYLLPADWVPASWQPSSQLSDAAPAPVVAEAASAAVLVASAATPIDQNLAEADRPLPVAAASAVATSLASVPAALPAAPLAKPSSAPADPAGGLAAASTPARPVLKIVQAPAPTGVAAGAAALLVRVRTASWVEVIDAQGQVLLSRLLSAGEQAAMAGLPPLRVKVGNVAGTELVLRGQTVDLTASAKENVARLELN